jgi:hypothetical protein
MTERPDRKCRWRGWRVTAAVVLSLFLYILSFGPAIWMLDHFTVPGSVSRSLVGRIYKPITWTEAHGPAWISDPLWYVATFFCWWGN